jgi:nucleotide-binding universal stress UspA family protein
MKSGQLLVHVEPGPVSEQRLRYALSMAQSRDMKLIGLAVRLSMSATVSTTMGDPMAMAALCEASGECCMTAKVLFDSVTHGSGIELEWREATGAPVPVVAAEAGRADLVIIGRNDRLDSESGVYQIAPADIIMASGTPVMVVSADAPLSFKARRILLAWKSTPQAVRAVHDALPLLKSAETVVLTEVVSESEDGKYEISAESMAAYLASHGIEVSIRRLQSTGDAGYQLVEAALDNECDLIVAGAYGHSRLREWVLGGVTRSLLDIPTMPCILSH